MGNDADSDGRKDTSDGNAPAEDNAVADPEVADGDGGERRVEEESDGRFGGGLPELTELAEVTEVALVEMLWPLPLLLSVSGEAGLRRQTVRRWLMAMTEVSLELSDRRWTARCDSAD